jgi:hypothetical protein
MEAEKTRRGPPRFHENRRDPKRGEGPFVRLVSPKGAEQVNPNGLTWNEGHFGFVDTEPSMRKYPSGGDFRTVGNRAGSGGVRGGYNIVNGVERDCKGEGGNRSGE